MESAAYLLILLLIASVFSGLGVAAQRRAGQGALLAVTIIATLMLLVAGYFDWRRLPYTESPLSAYVLGAVIPTVSAAGAIRSVRGWAFPQQWLLGAFVWCVAFFPAVLLSMILY